MKPVKIFDPKMDFVFKRIFGYDEYIFIDFINSIFSDKNEEIVKSVTFTNNEITKDSLYDKESRLDVRAVLGNGSHVNIEIQIRDKDGFDKRTLYYWSKLYEQQISGGDDYLKLKKSICINVLDFNIIEKSKKFHNVFGVTNLETHEPFLTDFEVHFLELPKLAKINYDKMTQLEKWLLLLKKPTTQVLKELSMTNPTIAKAVDTLMYLSQDPESRAIYEARLKYQLDFNTAVHVAEDKARDTTKIEIAKKLKSMGVSTEVIMKSSDLSKEQIESL
jgi:predicted transposase/invertase (TIGR01784 family)